MNVPQVRTKKVHYVMTNVLRDTIGLLWIVSKHCPAGFTDTGHHCTKSSYGRGAGRIPDKKPCSTWNSGWRDDGTSCWSDAHIYGKGCCCTIFSRGCCHNCKPGYNDDGCTCRKTDVGIKKTLFDRQTCRADEDLIAGLCYPKCKDGYKGVGPVCWATCPAGMTDIGVSCQKNGPINRSASPKPMICKANEDTDAGLCYTKCSEGYKGVGPICWKTCPAGMTDIGVSCQKNNIINRSSHPQKMTCKSDEEEVAGLCYPKCNEGYKGIGPICWSNCPSEMKSDNGTCLKKPSIDRASTAQPMVCQPNEEPEGDVCYDKCKDEYMGKGTVCTHTCPPDLKDAGDNCVKNSKIRAGQPPKCSNDFPDKIGDLCYGKCPEGFKVEGAKCTKI